MYVVSQRKLGMPQDSRDAFSLLQTARILPSELAQCMQRMVGFRTVAIHEYTHLNLEVVHSIITNQLVDLRGSLRRLLKLVVQGFNGVECSGHGGAVRHDRIHEPYSIPFVESTFPARRSSSNVA
ncbi:MAG: hypothetical protein NTAFB01_42460 [Nitrospira sp.]